MLADANVCALEVLLTVSGFCFGPARVNEIKKVSEAPDQSPEDKRHYQGNPHLGDHLIGQIASALVDARKQREQDQKASGNSHP